MLYHNAKILLLALFLAKPAMAEPPKVVADIAPVHALIAQVMGDIATPDLLLPPGASPHSYAMRPSDARKLQVADIVVWIGHDLTPWLEDPIANIAPNATVLELAETSGITLLEVRESAHQDHDDHAHHGHDPHLWLDPDNAIKWLDVIATSLGQFDPANAEQYRANADTAVATLRVLTDEGDARLSQVSDIGFLTYHDAYQYFEMRFGLTSLGAISNSDDEAPSAARLDALQTTTQQDSPACMFAEPQHSTKLVQAATNGARITTVTLDPLGAHLPIGPDHYTSLIGEIIDTVANCLEASTK